ncbi:MAG: hypothetical protein KJZ91_31220 [Myxococcales bacterium]|nr:hypothetical protein [Myxococcales bacterium]
MSFVLATEAKDIAGGVAEGASATDSLRSFLALTIAVVGATEELFQSVGAPYPDPGVGLAQDPQLLGGGVLAAARLRRNLGRLGHHGHHRGFLGRPRH